LPRHRSKMTSPAWQAAQLGTDAPTTFAVDICVTVARCAIGVNTSTVNSRPDLQP
jgi:hypothetical protein